MLEKTAIIMLAYSDYEAIELSLAAYAKTLKPNYKLFILQNGRNSYDCERTYRIALRYQNLFPENIKVIDWIKPQIPYFAIRELLNDDIMKEYEYICKVDDDVFPLRDDWFEKLIKCYQDSNEKLGEKLGYVTTLINNNPWGFKETLRIMELEQEYFSKVALNHIAGFGNDEYEPERMVLKNDIYTGWNGTVWRNPYISKWLHEKVSFNPKLFIEKSTKEKYKEVDERKRFSINCMLFKKELWNKIFSGLNDDELMIRNFCIKNDKKIIADLSNPFVHINFYTQREEMKDLLPKFRKVYTEFLNLPFSIGLCSDKNYEIENRLKYIEDIISDTNFEEKFLDMLSSSLNANKKVLLWGASNFLKKLTLKYNLQDSNILGVIDVNSARQGQNIGNFTIYLPEEIKKLKPDNIIVSIINNRKEKINYVKEFLNNYGMNNIEII